MVVSHAIGGEQVSLNGTQHVCHREESSHHLLHDRWVGCPRSSHEVEVGCSVLCLRQSGQHVWRGLRGSLIGSWIPNLHGVCRDVVCHEEIVKITVVEKVLDGVGERKRLEAATG